MPVRDEYLRFVLDQLSRVRPVAHRRMFGGVGLYADGTFFAVIDDDVLFLRTGDSNRDAHVSRGMAAFQPMGPGTAAMSYHEVPCDVLEDVARLGPWVEAAIHEAGLARRKPSGPRAARRAKAPGVRRRGVAGR